MNEPAKQDPAAIARGILNRGRAQSCQCYNTEPRPAKKVMRLKGGGEPGYVEVCQTCMKPGPICGRTQEWADRWIADGSGWYETDAQRQDRERHEKSATELCADHPNLREYVAQLEKERDTLRAAVKVMLPMVEEAFYDHHSAGCAPGSGYNHRVYHKVSDAWGWRTADRFEAFAKPLRAMLKGLKP